MSNTSEGSRSAADTRGKTSAVVMALTIMALGAFVAYDSVTGLTGPGYAQVGPGGFPVIVGIAVLLAGSSLLAPAVRGQWRVTWIDLAPSAGSGPSTASGLSAVSLRGLMLVAAALTLNVVLFAPLGFIAASAVLFACVSVALGSKRFILDVVIGVGLAATIYVVFVEGLGLQLPAGDLWESLPWTR
jgi:putative tricarboxylic transport membrane protein